jgi:hypothetical protein
LLNVVTNLQFNIQASCSKCPPSSWIPYLTRVTRELVTLRSTAVLRKVTSITEMKSVYNAVLDCRRPGHKVVVDLNRVGGRGIGRRLENRTVLFLWVFKAYLSNVENRVRS